MSSHSHTDAHAVAAGSDHSSGHGHGDHREGYDFAHPIALWILFAVFGALVLLTLITVWQSNFDFGSYDVAIVMIIATVKALLIALFFMHLAFDKPFMRGVESCSSTTILNDPPQGMKLQSISNSIRTKF